VAALRLLADDAPSGGGTSDAAAVRMSASDDALVARVRAGDLDAFEPLYRAHAGRVHALCLRMTGDPALAAELTQDAFVRAWQQLGSWRGDSAFGTWLHRIAVNVVLMQLRGDRRRGAHDGGELDADALAASTRPQDDARLDLDHAIAALPAGARSAFVLHEVEGYSHDEIARLTGIAPGTVRAQLFRARQLLVRLLS
jgi:RNA polymerase sigma-70 factor (ECF subfamily)